MRLAVVAVVAVLVLALLAGCSTLRSWTPSGRKAEATRVELQRLQARNMRFADDYVGRLIEAESITRPTLSDADQRLMISGWLLGQANAAYIMASGENPIIGTLDLLTLAVLSRMAIEGRAASDPALAGTLLVAHRQLEAQAWQIASTILDAAQRETVEGLFIEWHKRNPDFRSVMFVRFQDFVGLSGGEGDKSASTRGLFAMIGLDPLAGLDPAVQEVELSRLAAARAIFYAQRIPTLMDLQLERSLSRVAATPEAKGLQQQTASLTQSATRFAVVAEGLAETIAREREASIRQVSEALSAQQATLQPMLLELRAALEAGTAAATAVDQATRAIDALVASFSKPPGSKDAPAGKPFDIDDYGRAAAEIGRAAGELQRLFASIGTQTPQLDAALDASVAKSRSLIDYLFVRIAWLIALLLAGLLATLLLYRWIASRTRPRTRPHTHDEPAAGA